MDQSHWCSLNWSCDYCCSGDLVLSLCYINFFPIKGTFRFSYFSLPFCGVNAEAVLSSKECAHGKKNVGIWCSELHFSILTYVFDLNLADNVTSKACSRAPSDVVSHHPIICSIAFYFFVYKILADGMMCQCITSLQSCNLFLGTTLLIFRILAYACYP